MKYVKRVVNEAGDFTLQELDGKRRLICKGRVFDANEMKPDEDLTAEEIAARIMPNTVNPKIMETIADPANVQHIGYSMPVPSTPRQLAEGKLADSDMTVGIMSEDVNARLDALESMLVAKGVLVEVDKTVLSAELNQVIVDREAWRVEIAEAIAAEKAEAELIEGV